MRLPVQILMGDKMEEKVLFSNVSKLDENAVEKFNKVISKKIIGYAILIVVAFSGLIGGLLCIANLFLGIATIGVGVVVGIPLITYLIKDTMKKDAHKLLGGNKYLVHFDFYENEVLLKAEACTEGSKEYTPSGEDRMEYGEILKVIVSDTDIYIQRTGQANILDQRGMTKGTAGELIEFFKSKGIKVCR